MVACRPTAGRLARVGAAGPGRRPEHQTGRDRLGQDLPDEPFSLAACRSGRRLTSSRACRSDPRRRRRRRPRRGAGPRACSPGRRAASAGGSGEGADTVPRVDCNKPVASVGQDDGRLSADNAVASSTSAGRSSARSPLPSSAVRRSGSALASSGRILSSSTSDGGRRLVARLHQVEHTHIPFFTLERHRQGAVPRRAVAASASVEHRAESGIVRNAADSRQRGG